MHGQKNIKNIKPLADKHWVTTDSESTTHLTGVADGLAGILKDNFKR